jgi:hypothetical protein
MGQAAAASKLTSNPSGTSSSTKKGRKKHSSGDSKDDSLAATWQPLLLRMATALDQGIRFEAQWGPSHPEVKEASQLFSTFGEIAGEVPGGTAWLATFLLLSPAAHAEYGWLYSEQSKQEGQEAGDDALSAQPSLLQWLLDNTPAGELPAVQQQLLGVLFTASKVCPSLGCSRQQAACAGEPGLQGNIPHSMECAGLAAASAKDPCQQPGYSSRQQQQY